MSGIDSDLIRGHIDTIILKTLFDGDKYGYEILDEVAKKSEGAYELKQPTLYSCLKRLENQGLISSYWVDSEIGGKRHYYCLTEQGKETYIENQKNWLRSRQIIDNLIWEDAPAMPERQVVTEKVDNQETSTETNLEEPAPAVIDYIAPTSLLTESSTITENNESDIDTLAIESDDTDTLEIVEDENINDTLFEEDNNSNELDITNEEESISKEENEEQNITEENFDIMALLGHYDSSEQSNENIEEHIEKLNEANDTLASIEEEYSGNKFLENFVKNYMSSDDIEPNVEEPSNDTENSEEPEEIIDDFNLDLNKYLSNDDSYFSSTETKDKVNFITPNVVIDGLNSTPPQTEEDHIEFIEDDNNEIYSENSEVIEETNDVTPTYLSFGEEINPKPQESFYSYSEETYNNDNLYNNDDNDLDSIYSTSETNENNTYDSYNESLYSSYDTNESPNYFSNNIEQEETIEERTEINEIYTEKPNNEPTQAYDLRTTQYTDEESKKKLRELSTYAKESSVNNEEQAPEVDLFDTNDFLERNKVTKNYDKLISDFEKEGLNVRIHNKLVKEARESRTYVQTNKIKMTRNWISFCFIATILAIIFAVMHESGVNYYGFSYKYFVMGVLVALLVPIISTIVFALNPYKKNVAVFSPALSFMLSILVAVQLLLIVYCVNLQLGFFSFRQEYYNHLYWIIPAVITIYPILNSIVYTTLYKSKNFHS